MLVERSIDQILGICTWRRLFSLNEDRHPRHISLFWRTASTRRAGMPAFVAPRVCDKWCRHHSAEDVARSSATMRGHKISADDSTTWLPEPLYSVPIETTIARLPPPFILFHHIERRLNFISELPPLLNQTSFACESPLSIWTPARKAFKPCYFFASRAQGDGLPSSTHGKMVIGRAGMFPVMIGNFSMTLRSSASPAGFV